MMIFKFLLEKLLSVTSFSSFTKKEKEKTQTENESDFTDLK